MLSGPTNVPYFRCAMARRVWCIVTGLVWWRMSLVWVRRSGGRGVCRAVLTGGTSAFRRALHLSPKSDSPLSGGMGLLWVLWRWIVFQMVLVVTFCSRWTWYVVFALRTIVVHLRRLYRLSCLLVSVGVRWALLSARLVASFASVRLWFHQGASTFLWLLYGTVASVAWWIRRVMLLIARRVASGPWRSERSIHVACMWLPKLFQSAFAQHR